MLVLVFALSFSVMLGVIGSSFLHNADSTTASAQVGLALIAAGIVWAAISLVLYAVYQSSQNKPGDSTGHKSY